MADHSNWEARVGCKTVLGRLKYFFRLRLRGAVNPYYGFGSSSYTNIFEAFGFFLITDIFIRYLENYLLWLEYFLMGIDATMAFFSYVTIIPLTKYVYTECATVYVPSSKLGLSQPLSRQRVCPSPPERGGGAHSPAAEGSPNSDDRRKSLALLCDTTTQEQEHGGFHTYRSSFHTRIPSHDLSETLVCWRIITFIIFSLHSCVDLKYFLIIFICLHFSRKLTCQRRNSPLLKYTSTGTAMDNLRLKVTAPPNSSKVPTSIFAAPIPESITKFIEDQAFSQLYDLAPPPFLPWKSCLSFSVLPMSCRSSLLTGEGGGRGAKSYDGEKACPSINLSILSGLYYNGCHSCAILL